MDKLVSESVSQVTMMFGNSLKAYWFFDIKKGEDQKSSPFLFV
jgi:hypothetical protein